MAFSLTFLWIMTNNNHPGYSHWHCHGHIEHLTLIFWRLELLLLLPELVTIAAMMWSYVSAGCCLSVSGYGMNNHHCDITITQITYIYLFYHHLLFLDSIISHKFTIYSNFHPLPSDFILGWARWVSSNVGLQLWANIAAACYSLEFHIDPTWIQLSLAF